MKKLLSLTLSVIMLLSVFSCVCGITASAAGRLTYINYELLGGKFSFCEYTNGDWYYFYDEDTDEYTKTFIYDEFDLWQDGAKIELMYFYEPSDEASYIYTCVDGVFVDQRGNELDEWDFYYYTNQDEEPWSVGENTLYVCYGEEECEVTVEITESPVESVEFTPAEPIKLIQNVDGFKNYLDDGFEFYYDCETPFYAEGNKLAVTYKDGTTAVLTSDGEDYFDEAGNAVGYYDITCCDVQEESLWTELGDYNAEFYFMGCKFFVPVTVVENPVESISFHSEKPIKYFENTNGMWDYYYHDEDGDGEDEEIECYIYDSPLFIPGTWFTVNYKDGTSSDFYLNEEEYDYINENGESLALKGFSSESGQYDEPWGVGEHTFILEAFDRTCEASVEILDNPVVEFEFETAKPLAFKYAEGGEWISIPDEYGEEISFYLYDSSVYSPYEEGNTLTLTLEDGSTKVYTYTAEAGAFVDENGEAIPYEAEVMYVDVQFLLPWDETSPYNCMAVEFMGAYNVVPVYIENGLTEAPDIIVYNEVGKICVEWEPVAGAVEYVVYRKVGNAKNWTRLGTTKDCIFEDASGIKDGQKYTYTVRGVNPSGVSGEFIKAGVKNEYIAPVQGVKLENLNGKIKISWDDYNGVECYVFRITEDEEDWTYVTNAPGAGYYVLDSDVESGKEYTYIVLAARNGYESGYETFNVNYLATPKLKSIANATTGINVKWNAVKGAEAYRVYRKGATGGWTLVGTTTNTSFTDKAVANKNGSTYTYTVKAVSGKSVSAFDKTGLSIKRLGTVELSGISNSAGGVTLKWNTIKGANGYRVYRRVPGGDWKYIETTTKTSYTDKSVKANSGVKYNYTVRAAYNKTYGDYNRDGWDIVRLTAPVLKSAENHSNGAKVTWNKVKGAEGYVVYRKTNSTSWKKIAFVEGESNTTVIDKTAESGILYTYTVRASNGKDLSAFDSNGVSLKYLATPKLSAKVNTDGVYLKWNKPVGTKNFRIYRKTEGSSWVALKDVTSTSYTDKTVKTGVKYTYAVRAMNGKVVSNINTVSVQFISTPKVKSVANKTNGIEIKWGKIANVDGYRIYRKTGNGGWENLGDVAAATVSFVDETAVAGNTYSYTVKAFSGKNFSDYVASAEIIRVTEPEIVCLQKEASAVKVVWKPVEGADKYTVYRKLDGGWENIAVIKSEEAVTDASGNLYFIDENAEADKNYYYTVKAFNGSYQSSYYSGACLMGAPVM